MGFCRRCGDIVTGPRCKCGGTAVAPVLQWSSSKCQPVDKWSQTYISRDKSPTHFSIQIDGTPSLSQLNIVTTGPRTESEQCNIQPSSACRYSRPSSRLSIAISSHINSSVSSASRPSSPSIRSPDVEERSVPSSPAGVAVEAGILQVSHTPELSKVYGSVLQPKESLATYFCAICLAEFQPDATIFPDPSTTESSDRFLCRPCFVINGGSKGDCPVCHRPVLILRSEGGFVETSGRVWHKKCFRCAGCHKNIGNTPMVDLLGQPCCAGCFDSCLKRNRTPRRSHPLPNSEKADSQSPVTVFKDSRSREGSPAINELEQRLGIMKSREGSPVLEELTQRLNAVLNRTPRDSSPSMSSSSIRSNVDDRESSPLENRVLHRKKLATLTPSRQGIDPIDILVRDADFLDETRAPALRQVVHSDGPFQDYSSPSTRSSFDAVEEMKNRFLNQATSLATDSISSPSLMSTSSLMNSPTSTPSRIPCMSRVGGSPGLRHALSTSSLRSSRISWTPSTPDLIPDISDTLTQSSGPSSPPTLSPQAHSRDDLGIKDVALERRASGMVTPKPRDSLSKSSIPAATLSSGSLCAKCGGSLFATGGSGRFVTVPEQSVSGPPKTYHTECFRCVLCDGPFKETVDGQTIFVRGEGGACHVECAPPGKIQAKSTFPPNPIRPALANLNPPLVPLTSTIRTAPKLSSEAASPQPLKGSSHHNKGPHSSSRYERPPSSATSLSSSSSRFGSSVTCPGCQKAVSPMEMGVVPGPQGSRWHVTCLVCGGKGTTRSRRDKSQPGCGKRLDSAAKRDVQGGIWCRECLLLLPLDMRNLQVESVAKPFIPSHTGRNTGSGPFAGPQLTGTTTIARQFTGRGAGEPSILRQLTGGGLSPTRQLTGSPTKQLGLATPRARPKSVIGMRSSKSIDEGRGMFLVRQMTGGGGSFVV